MFAADPDQLREFAERHRERQFDVSPAPRRLELRREPDDGSPETLRRGIHRHLASEDVVDACLSGEQIEDAPARSGLCRTWLRKVATGSERSRHRVAATPDVA
ncbi:MAG: hypothetical protein R2752_07695 [Vicinamibacterales bacterium]